MHCLHLHGKNVKYVKNNIQLTSCSLFASVLKKDAERSSETSVNLCQITWRHFPEYISLLIVIDVRASNPKYFLGQIQNMFRFVGDGEGYFRIRVEFTEANVAKKIRVTHFTPVLC
jgi:hypothetical protein